MEDERSLTKREKLEWLLAFLYEEKRELEKRIEATELELKLEKKKESS